MADPLSLLDETLVGPGDTPATLNGLDTLRVAAAEGCLVWGGRVWDAREVLDDSDRTCAVAVSWCYRPESPTGRVWVVPDYGGGSPVLCHRVTDGSAQDVRVREILALRRLAESARGPVGDAGCWVRPRLWLRRRPTRYESGRRVHRLRLSFFGPAPDIARLPCPRRLSSLAIRRGDVREPRITTAPAFLYLLIGRSGLHSTERAAWRHWYRQARCLHALPGAPQHLYEEPLDPLVERSLRRYHSEPSGRLTPWSPLRGWMGQVLPQPEVQTHVS